MSVRKAIMFLISDNLSSSAGCEVKYFSQRLPFNPFKHGGVLKTQQAHRPFQNVRNEDQGIPSEEPKDFVQKPTSTVHLDLKMSSLDAKPMNTMPTAFAVHVSPSSQTPKQGNKTKTTVRKKPSKKQEGGKAKNRGRTKKTYKKEDPTATKAQKTATECFRCPICTVQIQHGRPFADHTLGRRHIEKLYSQNGAITQEDVDFYREILREQISRN